MMPCSERQHPLTTGIHFQKISYARSHASISSCATFSLGIYSTDHKYYIHRLKLIKEITEKVLSFLNFVYYWNNVNFLLMRLYFVNIII